uniref:Opticin n=1 Tax=Angiostrongylus cantonensis TaxID=6313 RepID=A0A0K0D8E6_ANGCA
LRALYLGDNDFEMLPGDVMNLRNLQILVLRDNDLLTIPREIGHLTNLKELHIQGQYVPMRLLILTRQSYNIPLLSLRCGNSKSVLLVANLQLFAIFFNL